MMKDTFTPEEWQSLIFSPFWTFNAVAAADRRVDQYEVAMLEKEIKLGQTHDDPLVNEVFTALEGKIEETRTALDLDGRSHIDGLRDVANFLEKKVSKEQADTFKKALFQLGLNVAAASNVGNEPTGRERDDVSKGERLLLATVVSALKLKW